MSFLKHTPYHSVQFNCSVMSESLWPHRLQHVGFPCPSSTPRAYPSSCQLSQWCHPTISSSVIPFSSLLQPSIRVFSNKSVLHIRCPKYWSCCSASVLPMNIQDWFPSGWTGWISLQSKGLSRVFSNTTAQKHKFSSTQLKSSTLTSIPGHWKNHSLYQTDLCWQRSI